MPDVKQAPKQIEDLSRATRRAFMGQLLAAGGAVALGAGAGAALVGLRPRPASALTLDPIVDFGNAAVGAERIGIAFYGNALGMGSDFSVPSDIAKSTLLNSAHRVYFEAAFNQETEHLLTLLSLTLNFPFAHFAFPPGTFDSAKAMLALGEQLESIFIGAYLGAIKTAASLANTSDDTNGIGPVVADLAAEICGIECEHRVLIRDIAGLTPPNDRFFEGDQPTTDLQGVSLGNTGSRSIEFTSGGDAVFALLALGIVPSK